MLQERGNAGVERKKSAKDDLDDELILHKRMSSNPLTKLYSWLLLRQTKNVLLIA